MYRVWWIPQIPGKTFEVEVDDLSTACLLTEVLANYDIFQYENMIKPDFSNAGGIQMIDPEDGEWVDIDEYEIEELLNG